MLLWVMIRCGLNPVETGSVLSVVLQLELPRAVNVRTVYLVPFAQEEMTVKSK